MISGSNSNLLRAALCGLALFCLLREVVEPAWSLAVDNQLLARKVEGGVRHDEKKRRAIDGGVGDTSLQGAAEDDPGRSVIGIRFAHDILSRSMFVTQVIKDAPAFVAGVRKGDKIMAVDGRSVAGLDVHRVERMIRGEPDEIVTLTLQRGAQTFDVSIRRGSLERISDKKFQTELLKQDVKSGRRWRMEEAATTAMVAAGSRRGRGGSSGLAAELCDEARFDLERGDYKRAEDKLKKAVSLDPGFSEAKYIYALLLDHRQQYAAAAEILEQVVAEKPNLVDAWQALGACYINENNLPKAIHALKKCAVQCEDRTRETEVRRTISQLQEQLARNEAGDTVFSATGYVEEADKLIDEGKYQDAEKKLQHAISLSAELPAAWHKLALCQQRLGKTKECAESFKQYMQLSGEEQTPTWLRQMEISALPSKDSAKSIEALQELLKTSLTDAEKEWVLNSLANALVKEGRFAQAESTFRNLLDVSSDSQQKGQVWQLIGFCQQSQGQLRAAIDSFTNGLELAPNTVDAPVIRDVVAALQEELKANQVRVPPDADNYLEEAAQHGYVRWRCKAPLKVYVHSTESVKGYRPEYQAMLKTALDEWSLASGSKIRFAFTSKPDLANIEFLWTDDPARLQSYLRGGETKLTKSYNEVQKAQVVIATMNAVDNTPIGEERIRRAVLHELGHALGIEGHSSSPGDVMFPFATQSKLSERDKKTLLALYTTPGRKLPQGKQPNLAPPIQIIR